MTRRRIRLLRVLLLVGMPLLTLAAGIALWQRGGRMVSTDNAYVKADIVQIAPEVAGRVTTVAVHDQSPVRAGALLVQLDPEPYRIALAKAEAELDVARNQVEAARATWRETRSELGEVTNQAAYYARQLQRSKELAAKGVVSDASLEKAQNDAAVARDRLIVVRRRLDRMLTALNGNPDIPTDSHPLVRQRKADRDNAALDLTHTRITAPVSGVAVNVRLQPGEQVKAAAPLFVIVADHRPWVEANLKETKLNHVRIGQPVKVVLDAYPQEVWDGRVESISPAAGSEFAILPPQNASGNWVKVVQRLPVRIHLLPHPDERTLRAGMTATVDIDTGRERHLSDLLNWITGHDTAQAASRH